MDRHEVRTGESLTKEIQTVPTRREDVVPLNCEAALRSYTEEERKEIIALSEAIDITEVDKAMNYGAEPLRRTFSQCGEFLKDERGSRADQEVLDLVITLAKKAQESYEDFNLVIKEPGFFQKLFLKLSTAGKESHTDRVRNTAITNYNLLMELKSSSEAWLEILKKAMGVISLSIESDVDTVGLLEKYIIAGKLAEERIEKELIEIQNQYNDTGLQKFANEYDEKKEGYDIFLIAMNNLEKSRVMYYLSLGQLTMVKRANRNVQISINTQVNESMALMAQQLRNATLNAKTKEVLAGQKAISKLNSELIKEVSKTIGITAEESEQLIYSGVYDVEAAKEAVKTVISSCNSIQQTAEEMLPKMQADLAELNVLIDELQPYVQKIEMPMANLPVTASATLPPESSTKGTGGLKF